MVDIEVSDLDQRAPEDQGFEFSSGQDADASKDVADSDATRSVASWDAIAQQAGKVDEEKLQDLKEDIDTILVFSGLFSSVLTTFLSASFQNLQVDNSALTVQLLSQIARQGNGTPRENIPPISSVAQSFSPPASAISVNVLWFASLILTLTTASVGFLVKPHIRRYLDADSMLPERNRLRLRHFHYSTFIRWRFFEIATNLRPLLQFAQGLFFVGLCIYAMSIHDSIGITSIVLVAFWAGLFLILVAPSHMSTLSMMANRLLRLVSGITASLKCIRSNAPSDQELGNMAAFPPYSPYLPPENHAHDVLHTSLTVCHVPGIINCLTPSVKARLLRSLSRRSLSDNAHDILGRTFTKRSQFLRSVATLLSDYAAGKLDKANLGDFSVVRLSLWLASLLQQTAASITEVSGEWETLLTALDRALKVSLAHETSADMWAAQLPLAASCLDILTSIRASEEIDGLILVPTELLDTLRTFVDARIRGRLPEDTSLRAAPSPDNAAERIAVSNVISQRPRPLQ